MNSILLVKHSQNTETPSCDDGHTQLWHGYSLLSFGRRNSLFNQDLGSSGSCVRTFTKIPALSCEVNGDCDYALRNDRSYWLSTTTVTAAIEEHETEKLISRCVVCEVPRTVITLHSQAVDIPDCPTGWTPLWYGYSLFAVSVKILNGDELIFVSQFPLQTHYTC